LKLFEDVLGGFALPFHGQEIKDDEIDLFAAFPCPLHCWRRDREDDLPSRQGNVERRFYLERRAGPVGGEANTACRAATCSVISTTSLLAGSCTNPVSTSAAVRRVLIMADVGITAPLRIKFRRFSRACARPVAVKE
jgi:hypothetical protein